MTYMSDATQWAAVGSAVRERMTALGVTEDELARKTALSPATIRGVLRGAGRRQRWTLHELSKALDWPSGHLVAVAEGRTPPTAQQTAPAGNPESHPIDMFTPETHTGSERQDHYQAAAAETAHDCGDISSHGVRM